MIGKREPVRILLVSSRLDPAGTSIHREIMRLLREEERSLPGDRRYDLMRVQGRLIEQDHLDESLSFDLIVFLSRHSSKNPVPVLTVHPTGNFFDADLGGRPRSLAPAEPAWMYTVLRNLARLAPAGYRVSYEATHHGPTELRTPSFFVEIGSTDHEWRDPIAAAAVARSVMEAGPGNIIPLIGLGGTHYTTRQTEIALTTPGAFGHIAPTGIAGRLTFADIRSMSDKSSAIGAYIDRKSLSSDDLSRIEQMVGTTGLVLLQTSDLIALNEIPWKVFKEIREISISAGEGVRSHFHALAGSGLPVPIKLDEELLAVALAADEGMFVRGLSSLPVVHLSGPRKSVLPVFITYQGEESRVLDDLITLCVTIITIKEETAIDGDHLVIRKTRFDPGKARQLGIPKGPLFGRLMKGEPVPVGDRVITPDLVQSTTERRIHIPGLEKFT
ncbi:MAG: D-tyrosyl-tRNA(Tyr) deacylase [Methanoregulaceae archaeon]|nr:D-tyrosyl-tRNA(Tyr) deacylase [Methanoregulaceae archaeon]